MLARHPVVQALPEAARDLLFEQGTAWKGASGDRLPDDAAVRFICEGALGLVARPDDVCVGLCGPGMTHGWEHGFSDGVDEGAMVVLDAAWVEAPASALTARLGEAWMERVFARQAIERLKLIEAEAACNARHQTPQRLAKWALRLHRAVGEPGEVRVTQATMASLIGVQRTSVNAAVRGLQDDGVLRFVRGRMIVRDPAKLETHACDCVRR